MFQYNLERIFKFSFKSLKLNSTRFHIIIIIVMLQFTIIHFFFFFYSKNNSGISISDMSQ